ncbi:MAG TPA: hypothetical protein VGZ51_07220, partial [Actinomycetota bacterium]|nr:hypothetical protein [Actinomycetota bacterium]
ISTRYSDSYTRARESVRLLPRGERPSTLLFSHEFTPRPCAHMPVLAWRGNDLLYWTSEEHAVVIDSVSGEHLDLTGVVRRLPGAFQQAAWA